MTGTRAIQLTVVPSVMTMNFMLSSEVEPSGVGSVIGSAVPLLQACKPLR